MSTAQPSCVAGATEAPLRTETIDHNFVRAVRSFGDRDALIVQHQGIRWSYEHLHQRIDELARGLLANGVNVGDRVAVWSPNRYEWILVQYATARIGAVMVCVNPAYRTSELEFVLRQSG